VEEVSSHERVAKRPDRADVVDALAVKHGRDAIDLPFECVELAGAIASVDEQLLAPGYENVSGLSGRLWALSRRVRKSPSSRVSANFSRLGVCGCFRTFT
jgi:hypothetical protein